MQPMCEYSPMMRKKPCDLLPWFDIFIRKNVGSNFQVQVPLPHNCCKEKIKKTSHMYVESIHVNSR